MTLQDATTLLKEEERYQPDIDEDSEDEDDTFPLDQYNIISSPNDFNVKTIVDFIESGVMRIPGFPTELRLGH